MSYTMTIEAPEKAAWFEQRRAKLSPEKLGDLFVAFLMERGAEIFECEAIAKPVDAASCRVSRSGNLPHSDATRTSRLRRRRGFAIISTESTTMLYGELMAVLRKAGTKIPTNDVWIGAFAKERGAAVLSSDHHMKALIPSGVELVDFEEVRHA